jgi:hypothetical protein
VHEQFSYLLNICTYNSIVLLRDEAPIPAGVQVVVALDTPKPSMLELSDGISAEDARRALGPQDGDRPSPRAPIPRISAMRVLGSSPPHPPRASSSAISRSRWTKIRATPTGGVRRPSRAQFRARRPHGHHRRLADGQVPEDQARAVVLRAFQLPFRPPSRAENGRRIRQFHVEGRGIRGYSVAFLGGGGMLSADDGRGAAWARSSTSCWTSPRRRPSTTSSARRP